MVPADRRIDPGQENVDSRVSCCRGRPRLGNQVPAGPRTRGPRCDRVEVAAKAPPEHLRAGLEEGPRIEPASGVTDHGQERPPPEESAWSPAALRAQRR